MAWFVLVGLSAAIQIWMSSHVGVNPLYLLIMLLGPIGLIAMVAGKRSVSAGYILPSICLGVFAARSIQTSFYWIRALIRTPSIYDGIPISYQLLGLIAWALMCYLFYRFTFGLPSRAYFGMVRFDASALGRRIKVRLLGL